MPDQPRFLSGSKIYLRPLERADLNERYLHWLNDAEVTQYLETGAFPTTRDDLEKFYAQVTGSSTEVIFAIADRKTHAHIGNVKLGPINWVHRRTMFGIMIGDKRFWRRGVGEEVTRLMVEYAFDRLNLNRVGLVVFEEHESAVRCYQNVGFKVEGCLREQMYQGGKYKNHLWMGLLKSEYKTPRAKKGK
ncbi:MAG TPA: GNAT family protein [Candidatus Sulfotelmatobacter sp.]|nr:GNAT family protein [Candidatus Sulfotelmatobacter sp.]